MVKQAPIIRGSRLTKAAELIHLNLTSGASDAIVRHCVEIKVQPCVHNQRHITNLEIRAVVPVIIILNC